MLHPADLSDAELDEMEVDCIDDSDYRLPPGPPLVFDEPEKPAAPEPKKPEQKKKVRSFPFSSHLNPGGTDRD